MSMPHRVVHAAAPSQGRKSRRRAAKGPSRVVAEACARNERAPRQDGSPAQRWLPAAVAGWARRAASTATVVPRRGQDMSAQATIVVGVDGSDCSRTALEFALDEAVLRGAGVRVVAA